MLGAMARVSIVCVALLGCASPPRPPVSAPPPPPQAQSQPQSQPQSQAQSAEPTPSPSPYPPGLEVVDVKVGSGPACRAKDTIRVRYVGTLDDGTEFDAQADATFTIGVGTLIRGWDEGIPGMRVGGVRRLTVPASLGYGAKGSPPDVPPFAQLHFEVELLGIEGGDPKE